MVAAPQVAGMKRKTVPTLIAMIAGLLLVLLVLRSNDGEQASGQLLLPAFAAVANDTSAILVQGPDGVEAVSLQRVDEHWRVGSRNDYPADIGKLRQLVVALAEARILEEKTSDPDLYEKLGVDDPESGKGSRVTVSGQNFEYAVILGDRTQGKYRYARETAATASYLIDQDPTLPASADEWLLADILDIAAKRVKRISIAHADGETIVIAKDTEEQTDFSVLDMPDGRELSYATIANGIGGALAALKLQSVRQRIEASAATTTTEFQTWDGLSISMQIVTEDDESWIGFAAAASETEGAIADEAEDINKRLTGWQYQLPDYKNDLLVRRWDDLLKAPD